MSERACLASGRVRQSPFVRFRSSLGGASGGIRGCGAIRPLEVTALDSGRVRLTTAATLRCPMVPALDKWTRSIVAPAAIRHLGSPVERIRVIASYACRPINSKRGNKLSEHGRANAIDISAFELRDGRVITLKRGWRGRRGEAMFLRALHRGACKYFTTVLGPNANRYHHDHFHFDLARHGRSGTYRVCR
ncbi:MAG: extensin family protein [Pseudomonadota bacterium]